MITNNDIDEAIYKRWIAPTKNKKQKYIGTEFELPIVNLDKKAVDFKIVHRLTKSFAEHFGFDSFHYDDDGNICAAEHSDKNGNGDSISFDCSYNTLELSFGKETSLHRIDARFRRYVGFINEFLSDYHHILTGMGLNPYYQFDNLVPIPNGRYRMLLHHLKSYEKYADQMLFHNIPYYGLIACSEQTHIDVSENELVRFINVFNRLEPFKALLFANSPSDEYLCLRDHLWRESMHGLNPHNVDSWNVELHSVDEIVAYIRSMSLYCTERDGHYINFTPTPLETYFASKNVTGEYWDGNQYQRIEWQPELNDLQYLRSFKFVDLTFRGTLELRSTCTQPFSEAMSVPALNVGLSQRLGELEEILDKSEIFRYGYTTAELRKMFVKTPLPAFAHSDKLKVTLHQIVWLAYNGLRDRGLGEEELLLPLLDRADRMESPAAEMVRNLKNGKTLEDYILRYGSFGVNAEEQSCCTLMMNI